MAWFAIYKNSDGVLLSTGESRASDAQLAAAGLAFVEVAFDPQVSTKQWNKATRVFDDVAAPKPRIDTLDFWKRFTVAERETIQDEARGTTARATKVRGFVETYKTQGAIAIDDPEIVTAVNDMETAGLIGANRAAEVLA